MNERNIKPTVQSPTKYDYSDDNRVDTVLALQSEAKAQRISQELKWRTDDAYYDGIHRQIKDFEQILKEDEKLKRLTESVCVTDPYIQVESQINPNPMEPCFYGRDFMLDEQRAKQREYTVKYICQNNDLESKSTSIERSMLKYADSLVKVFWDDTMPDGAGGYGDIRVEAVKIDDFFPDHNALCLEDCEYIQYVYYAHKNKVARMFRADLKRLKINIDELTSPLSSETEVITDTQRAVSDDRLQVLEHWYRDEEGDINCVILIDEIEIRHIKKYWQKTGLQNKLYPFVHFYKLRDERRFWNKSEIETIIPLVNAADTILNTALDNMKTTANDVILVQEGSVEDSDSITNEPGAVIEYKQGFQAPQRLGGLNSLKDFIPNINFIQSQIERTLRNFDANQGKAAARTTTATEIMQNSADTQEQSKKKEYDRKQSYKRLFILIDWSALEFYDTNKLIYIGVPGAKKQQELSPMGNIDQTKGDIYFMYNSAAMQVKKTKQRMVHDDETGKDIMQDFEDSYFPMVDCNVVASNAIEKSKSFNVSVLQNLLGMPITADNYKIVIKLIEEIEIEGGSGIIDDIKKKYEVPIPFPQGLEGFIAALPPEQQTQLKANPTLALGVYANALEAMTQPDMGGETVNNAGIA